MRDSDLRTVGHTGRATGLSLALLLLSACPLAATDPAAGDLLLQDAPPPPGIMQFDGHAAPLYYDPVLLELGRDLYADLQRVDAAARNRDPALTRIALKEARDDLSAVRLPAQQAAVISQLRIIRNDLADRTKLPDRELWLPLQVDVDEVLKGESVDVRSKAHAAVQQGVAAAAHGDHAGAGRQLEEVASSLHYSLGIFPLDRMDSLLDSAWGAVHKTPLDWPRVQQLARAAMASVRWYAQVPVTGLAGAYNDIDNAARIAAGVRDDTTNRQIGALLRDARSKLGRSDSDPLVQQVLALQSEAAQNKPLDGDLSDLMSDMRSQIHYQQRHARDRYWQMVGDGVMP